MQSNKKKYIRIPSGKLFTIERDACCHDCHDYERATEAGTPYMADLMDAAENARG